MPSDQLGSAALVRREGEYHGCSWELGELRGPLTRLGGKASRAAELRAISSHYRGASDQNPFYPEGSAAGAPRRAPAQERA